MDSTRGRITRVVFVPKRQSKSVKTALEKRGWLNRDFKLTSADDGCLAVPITDDCELESTTGSWIGVIQKSGEQWCMYSSKALGNNRLHIIESKNGAQSLTLVQKAIVQALAVERGYEGNDESNGDDRTDGVDEIERPQKDDFKKNLCDSVTRLSTVMCPKKLELLGNDGTLIVPPGAFCGDEFESLLAEYSNGRDKCDIMKCLWENLATMHNNSPRVAQRGTINPNSGIRQSGHTLLWPPDLAAAVNSEGFSDPKSPGWITVTEHGIRQSFDLTRVMFSRGNVTEKKRFGQTLVKEGEIVLDLYAGIGYYTLPALIHGKASHVFACEWNEHAASALKFNLKDNGVDDRATVIVGDSRFVLETHHQIIGSCNRISLGLLPSSEGTWEVAAKALHKDIGGWLHVHGNVLVKERDDWARWLCHSFQNLVNDDWIVVCTYVEPVKSFAPKVMHYVADVYCGPEGKFNDENVLSSFPESSHSGVIIDGVFSACSKTETATVPSCALDINGVLHQEWMQKRSPATT